MNDKTNRRLLKAIVSASLTVLTLGASAQTVTESGTPVIIDEDSTGCRGYIALYKASYTSGSFSEALDPWRRVLEGCPDSTEEIYIDGESMYKNLYSQTGDLAYIDTILNIITQRTYYFDNKPSNDLHKCELLFELAGDDPGYLGLCYNILAETAESHADQMGCSHFVLMATAAASLYGMEIIGPEELEQTFVTSIGTLESRINNNKCDGEYADDLTNLEMYFTTCGAMTCNSIEMLYSEKVDSNFRDREFIDKVFMMLTETGCTGSDLYYNVAVKLFANDRTTENAVRLAELNIERNNTERAISYFTEAYNRDTSSIVRSGVLTRVAIMELGQGKRQEARDRAEHAWELDKTNARALMILADCYAGAELGNSFDNHTAYWVAVDYLEAAIMVDPSLKQEAASKIRAWSQLFPTREECFYRKILDEGTIFNVGGWISEVTRVRFRRE
ncbi:tetratricopeptide repeat protein [bacterium]|nr:tetratricopeptide repeat protein [bacterium]